MAGFIIRTQGDVVIRCRYYDQDAPVTSAAFARALPFTRTFYHARVSGEEIWIDDAPERDIIQENASVFTAPGEVVFGPMKPKRTKTAGCLGIYYGEGKGLDCANIFAKVEMTDLPLLRALGEEIWRHGVQVLRFEAIE